MLDSVHIDINNEGVDEEDMDMEVQMDDEEAAAAAADQMIEGFWIGDQVGVGDTGD